jgi:hypothetical protein
MRCETRTLDDIRKLGGNDAADERRFATAARVSEINLALYRAFAQPFVRAMASGPAAEWMRRMHPLRLQYELFSDANPLMDTVQTMAEEVREDRRPVSAGNPLLALQENLSEQIVANLDTWRQMSETFAERTFLSVYGSPALQAAVGIDPADERPPRKAGKSPLHRELVETRIAALKSRIATGGPHEAVIRGLLYVGMARGAVDERGLAAIRRLRATREEKRRLTVAEFKALLREQFFMLLIDEEATLAAIPDLLPSDPGQRRRAFAALRDILSASRNIEMETAERLRRIAALFGVDAEQVTAPPDAAKGSGMAKAS